MISRIIVVVAGVFFVVWLAAVILLHTIFHLYRVPTGAMEPTIHAGDSVITRKIHDVRRGDIIAFDYPLQPKVLFVKRVIGMPGETIEIKSKRVFINGREISDPHAFHDDDSIYPANRDVPEPFRSRDHFGPLTIGAGEYFMMGDNRDRSSDSRYWGPVREGALRARAVYAIGRSGFRRIGR